MFEEVLGEIENTPSKELEPNSDYYGSLPEFEIDHAYDLDDEGDEDEGESDDDEGQGKKSPKAPKEVKVYQWYDEVEYCRDRLPYRSSSQNSRQADLTPYNLKTPGQPFQVIVKLANIELTPNNQIYDGGAWHVEGMTNEKRCRDGHLLL